MSVRLETTIRRFVGNSADTKPELDMRDAGSSFLEEDTGKISRWNGRTWTNPAPGDDPLSLIADQLNMTNELLQLILEKL